MTDLLFCSRNFGISKAVVLFMPCESPKPSLLERSSCRRRLSMVCVLSLSSLCNSSILCEKAATFDHKRLGDCWSDYSESWSDERDSLGQEGPSEHLWIALNVVTLAHCLRPKEAICLTMLCHAGSRIITGNREIITQ